MDTKKQIEVLEDFRTELTLWSHTHQLDVQTAIRRKLAAVRQIVENLGLKKIATVALPAMFDAPVMYFDPLQDPFGDTFGRPHCEFAIAIADEALGALEHGVLPKKSKPAETSKTATARTNMDRTSREPPKVINNHIYNVSGQVAAIGPHANATGNVMVQQVQQPWSNDELAQVAAELSQLRKALAQRLAASDDNEDSAYDAIEIGCVGEAANAAKKGDQAGVLSALKRLGRRTWDLVEQLGLEYLKLKAGAALGLAPGNNEP